MDNLSIGARIRQRRKELGLTQMQIKQEIGISSGNMSDIENGNKLPSTPALISLSSLLNCSIDWILKGENYNHEMQFLSNEREVLLLNNFRKLPINDQEELIEILEIKLRKTLKGKETSTESSLLTEAQSNNIAG